MATFTNRASGQSPKKPDFAFPTKVEASSDSRLTRAIEAQDAPQALRALIDWTVAKSMVGADGTPKALLQRLDSVAVALTDPAGRALAHLLQARVAADIFEADSWKYNRRDLPPEPLAANPEEWSGDQFRAYVNSRIDKALEPVVALKSTSIEAYEAIIDIPSRLTRQAYPTLLDFVAPQAIDIIRGMGQDMPFILPGRFLDLPTLFVAMRPETIYNADEARILHIYQLWEGAHPEPGAPMVTATLSRLEFVNSHLATADDENDDNGEADSRYYDALHALFTLTADSEWSGLVALEMAGEASAAKEHEVYAILSGALQKYPAFALNPNITNRLRSLAQPSMTVDMSNLVIPGREFTLTVHGANVKAGRIDIYAVPASFPVGDNYFRFNSRAIPRRVATLNTGRGDSLAVPFRFTDSLTLTLEEPGRYIAVPSVSESPCLDNTGYEVINCSAIMGGAAMFKEAALLAVDAVDGAPVEGASIVDINSKKNQIVGRTNSEGMLTAPSEGYNRYVAKKDGSMSLPFAAAWRSANEKTTMRGEILTALNLYRPGDTVEWSAVVYSVKGRTRTLAEEGTEFTLITRDANSQPIDTLEVATDGWGRVDGSVTLPTDGLQGSFTMALTQGSRTIAWKEFTVSDYKLPTFEVLPDAARPDVPTKGAVTLGGKALAYSGFPIADAAVAVTLEQSSGWFWGNRVKFYAAAAATEADGSFSVVIPADVFDNSPFSRGVYFAKITVTSPAGETRDTSVIFSRSPMYAIQDATPANLDVSAGRVRLKIKVEDPQGKPQTIPLEWTLGSVAKGTFSSADPIIDFTNIPSGEYKLTLRPVNRDVASEVTGHITIYRPSDSESPSKSLLWTPVSSVDTGSGSRTELLVGVARPTHILMGVWDADSLYSRTWIEARAGMHRIPVALPSGVDQVNVTLTAVAEARTSEITVGVEASARVPRLEIRAESFRDRLTPGASETWRLKVVTANDSRGRQAAVMAKLYNAALDALASQGWQFGFFPGYSLSWNVSLSTGWQVRVNDAAKLKMLTGVNVGEPSLETWDRALYGGGRNYYLRGSRAMKMSAATTGANMEYESIMVVDEVKEEAADAEAADLGAPLKEEVVQSARVPAPDGQQPFAYRDSETPLAFFKPMLTSEPDGSLCLQFTVPNANTRWEFNAVAYTERLLQATLKRSATAAKPVMVQPNLPRFLRQGDVADVASMVMNNSDSPQTVQTVVEIFNPATGTVTDTRTFTNSLAAGGSATVTVKITAPAEGAFIGYRVKSSAGNFADGEQALIPILPASQPVVEAIPFYLGPDQHTWSVDLPKMKEGARVTLEMTENPVWTVVTALPGLMDNDPTTANEAAAAIFAAASAKGIVKANPAIEQALREWRDNPADSTLVSMLERNSDLKAVLLSATPWMLDAASDTERMARLTLLLDPDQADRSIASALKTLGKLQTSSGGWTWMGQIQEPSQWVTTNVLMMLGRLKTMGMLPSDKKVNPMIAKALRWLDSEIATEYKKYPNGNYTLYTYLRDMFPDVAVSTGAQAAVSATVQQLIGRWKDLPLIDKGIAATILDNHSYRTLARQVVASILDFSQVSEAKGRFWPSLGASWWRGFNPVGSTAILLDAIAAVTPDDRQAIDQVRQWIILQKQTQDWGWSVSTAEVVASMLTTSQSWLQPAQGVSVELGGEPVTPTKVAAATGYFRTPLSDAASKQITIDKPAATPAYGAVFMQYTAPMSELKAVATEDVAITKRLLRVAGTGVEAVKPGEPLRVGDRIRVELTITVDRTVDYVAISDARPACLEPVEQLPRPVWSDGICFYRENRDSATNIYVTRMPKGTYLITTEFTVNNAGTFEGGIATLQSQYAPSITAHSAPTPITVR